MATYYTATVIQPTIPDHDLTPLERLLLPRIFQYELNADGWYFFAQYSMRHTIIATRAELERALSTSPDTQSVLHGSIAEQLNDTDPNAGEIRLEFIDADWEEFFQAILRRSNTLQFIAITCAFYCSKMEPQAFGGSATLITRERILTKSTTDLIDEFRRLAGFDDRPPAPDAPPTAPT